MKQKKIYGAWSGNTEGVKEDITKCIKEVFSGATSFVFHQCNRKRGYGKDGLYCKQHDPQKKKSSGVENETEKD